MATTKQIHDAAFDVLKRWRPGMSDQVRGTLARGISEQAIRNAERDDLDAAMVEYGQTLQRRMSWIWRVFGFNRL